MTDMRARSFIALASVLLLAAAARLYGITGESAWGDEVLTLRHLPAPGLGVYLQDAFREDPVPRMCPAYYTLQFGWASLFGGSVLAMRMLSLVLSLFTVALVWHLGRALADTRTGTLAAGIFALSLVSIYYAQEVRFYAFMTLLAVASFEGLRQVLAHPNRPRGWIINLSANALLLWTHAFAPLVLVTQGIALLALRGRRPRQWIGWGLAHAGLAALFFAWLLLLQYDFRENRSVFNDIPPSWRELATAIVVFAGGRFSNENPAPYMPFGISLDLVIAALLGGFTLWALCAALKRDDAEPQPARRENLILLALWFVVPLAVLYATALFWRPVFFYRYILYAAVPLYLLAAIGLSQVQRPALRNVVTAILLAAMAWQVFALPRPFRPDYNAMGQAVVDHPAPSKHVLALKAFNGLGVSYALSDSGVAVTTHHGFRELTAAAIDRAQRGETVWVVFHRWARADESIGAAEAAGLRVTRLSSAGIPPLEVLRVAPADVRTFKSSAPAF
jgi:4-amino-4-deoxy-L-arabinose transferase-like glycosyltransferase